MVVQTSRAGHLWPSGVVEMGWLGAGAGFPRAAPEPGRLPACRLRPLRFCCMSAMDSLASALGSFTVAYRPHMSLLDRC